VRGQTCRRKPTRTPRRCSDHGGGCTASRNGVRRRAGIRSLPPARRRAIPLFPFPGDEAGWGERFEGAVLDNVRVLTVAGCDVELADYRGPPRSRAVRRRSGLFRSFPVGPTVRAFSLSTIRAVGGELVYGGAGKSGAGFEIVDHEHMPVAFGRTLVNRRDALTSELKPPSGGCSSVPHRNRRIARGVEDLDRPVRQRQGT